MTSVSILVVDDEPAILSRLSEVVREFGHTPLEANNGAEAKQKLLEHSPDLVITDLNLPDTSGLEILREVRSFNRQIPVAIITGYARVDTAVRAIQGGAFDYISKPLKMEELEKIIDKGLRIRRGFRDPALLAPYGVHQIRYEIPSRAALLEVLAASIRHTLENSGTCTDDIIQDVILCLEEALVNAVLHGNRLDEGKMVRLEIAVTATEIRLAVEDEGDGFDYAPFLNKDDLAKVMSQGGHGLFLMLCLMDEVGFNERGNGVTLVKRNRGSEPPSSVR